MRKLLLSALLTLVVTALSVAPALAWGGVGPTP
jgi:hypothetical protein